MNRSEKQMASFRITERVRAQLGWLAEQLTEGNATEALEQAVSGWTDSLRRAGADNASTFTPEEWCLIADVCNGTLWTPGIGNPGALVAANVEDGHRLDGSGYRWLGLAGEKTEVAGSLARVGAGKPTRAMRQVDAQVADLCQRLAALDAAHGWAVVLAVTWFWRHCQDIDIHKHAWWQPAFQALYERQRLEGEEASE